MKNKDRFRGCLVGGAVGDALGYPIESFRLSDIRRRHGERGIIEYELCNGVAQISDDSQMTLFTATGLILAATRSAERGIGSPPLMCIGRTHKDWYRAAGSKLDKATAVLGGCDVGDAKITDVFNLPSKFIVLAVGPIWIDGKHKEPELLASCYTKSLQIAFDVQCKSITFPLISSSIFGYPKDKTLQIAWQTISQFLLEHDMDVFITIFDSDALKIGKKLFADVQQFIDDNYVANHTPKHRRISRDSTFRRFKATNTISQKVDVAAFARYKGDLKRLCTAHSIKCGVQKTPHNDYPYRMNFSRDA